MSRISLGLLSFKETPTLRFDVVVRGSCPLNIIFIKDRLLMITGFNMYRFLARLLGRVPQDSFHSGITDSIIAQYKMPPLSILDITHLSMMFK